MKQLNKILLVILFFVLLGFVGYRYDYEKHNNPVEYLVSKVESINKTPKGVFKKAWRTVKNNYVDSSYNHQDWEKWLARYSPEIETYEDSYVAIETMLESLNDPYSRFLKPKDLVEQDMSIDAKLHGIGVHISKIDGNVEIVSVLDETPAKKNDLREHDRILKVDKTSTKGMSLSEVAEMVRGKVGSSVILTILRDKKQIIKNIVREEIKIKTVKYEMLENDIGYIKISSFISHDTSDEFQAAIDATKDAKGLIIDVRGNYGGLLPNAIYMSNMFIDKGTIVSIVDREGNKQDFNARSYCCLTHKPTVILIDRASASASEIFSGALKDHNRAVLVGKKTFGKGRVQRILRMPDGSGINLTIAKYLTPNGRDIDKKGIEPDYEVELTKEQFLAGEDPQLDKAKELVIEKIASLNN